MKKTILVIGSLNMDISITMEKMPILGETTLGKTLEYNNGGKGANQACAIGKLNGKVEMLGCIGKDSFGKSQEINLTNFGVNTRKLKISDKEPTGTAVIYVDKNGKNSIVVVPGANNECSVEYLKTAEESFEKADFILLQLEIPMNAIKYCVEKGKKLGKTIILNPAPAPDYIPEEILNKIDYLTPNETELQHLSNIKNIDTLEEVEKGAKILLSKGIKNILVTLGENGVLLVNDKVTKHFPAHKVNAIDTTAAGDCFNGAFVLGLSEGKILDEAIEFANIASSISVIRKGAQKSLPTREEVEKIKQNYKHI